MFDVLRFDVCPLRYLMFDVQCLYYVDVGSLLLFDVCVMLMLVHVGSGACSYASYIRASGLHLMCSWMCMFYVLRFPSI